MKITINYLLKEEALKTHSTYFDGDVGVWPTTLLRTVGFMKLLFHCDGLRLRGVHLSGGQAIEVVHIGYDDECCRGPVQPGLLQLSHLRRPVQIRRVRRHFARAQRG